jgi:hypothetical protein
MIIVFRRNIATTEEEIRQWLKHVKLRRIKNENIHNYYITANTDSIGRTELSKYERRRHAENDATDAKDAVLLGKD